MYKTIEDSLFFSLSRSLSLSLATVRRINGRARGRTVGIIERSRYGYGLFLVEPDVPSYGGYHRSWLTRGTGYLISAFGYLIYAGVRIAGIRRLGDTEVRRVPDKRGRVFVSSSGGLIASGDTICAFMKDVGEFGQQSSLSGKSRLSMSE
jgi:hypothetical protein